MDKLRYLHNPDDLDLERVSEIADKIHDNNHDQNVYVTSCLRKDFFLYYHFSLVISYSVWLGFELFGLVQVFTLVRGGCDNHKCHNRNPI